MVKDDALINKTRKQIYSDILKHPGIYLRELSRKLQIPTTTMNYHLDYLQKRGYIVGKPDGRFIRYYITQNIGVKDKELLHLFRQQVSREIIIHLVLSRSSSKNQLIAMLERHPATINSHLKKLIQMGIVERSEIASEMRYRLKNPEQICDFLVNNKESLSEFRISHILNMVEYGLSPARIFDGVLIALYEVFPHPYYT